MQRASEGAPGLARHRADSVGLSGAGQAPLTGDSGGHLPGSVRGVDVGERTKRPQTLPWRTG